MTEFIEHEVSKKDYIDASFFEVNLVGKTILAPIDLTDDDAVADFFNDNEEIELSIDGRVSSYELMDLSEDIICRYSLSVVSKETPVEASVEPEPVVEVKHVLPGVIGKPVDENDRAITIVSSIDGAAILVNGESVYHGNTWDFYSGCAGTKIADVDVDGIWDTGVVSLALALKTRFVESGLTVSSVSKIDFDEEAEDSFWHFVFDGFPE